VVFHQGNIPPELQAKPLRIPSQRCASGQDIKIT
jgi:hypothetical protein